MDNSRSYFGGGPATNAVGVGVGVGGPPPLDAMTNVTNALKDTTIGGVDPAAEADNARNRFLASRRFVGCKKDACMRLHPCQ